MCSLIGSGIPIFVVWLTAESAILPSIENKGKVLGCVI